MQYFYTPFCRVNKYHDEMCWTTLQKNFLLCNVFLIIFFIFSEPREKEMYISEFDKRKTAMGLLYKKFYRQLFLYAVTFLESDEEAKDVVSEVFTIIWQKWQAQEDLQEPSSPYLYTLVRNKCLDVLRHDQAKQNYTTLMDSSQSFYTSEAVMDYEQRIEALQQVISHLPEPGKTILRCTYFKKMTYQQTADLLQISLKTVKRNMLKVFKIIHNSLNKEYLEG